LRLAGESSSGDLSEFLSTSNQMAVRRDSLGRLKGFIYMATYLQTVDLQPLASADVREALIVKFGAA